MSQLAESSRSRLGRQSNKGSADPRIETDQKQAKDESDVMVIDEDEDGASSKPAGATRRSGRHR